MMNIGGSSSVPEAEWGINDIDVDLESWFEELLADSSDGPVMDSGEDATTKTMVSVDATTTTPNDPGQPFMSTTNGGTNLGEGSSNVSQSDFSHEIMAVNSLTPSSSSTTMQSEGILSSAVQFISNISAQTLQPQTNTDFPQYQPLLQDKGKAVEQPTTYPLADQSNLKICDQLNQLQYQMLSNQLLPCTLPMVVNTQTVYLQNDEALSVQMQQNLNQIQSQLQQATESFGDLILRGRPLGFINNLNLTAPVGFATPSQFVSTTAYREYVLRQIRKMKERYNKDLLKMHYNAMELRARATNPDVADNYQKAQLYLEKMITFLNITRVDLLPRNDETLYNYMNTVVNYVCYHMTRRNGEPVLLPPIGPQVQPIGGMMLQNLEINMLNLNNFPTKSSYPHPTQSRMSSSQDNISFQTGPQSNVLSTTQQMIAGPTTSSVIGSSSPISLFTNTSTNFPSRPLNHQRHVVNQNLNLEKMKAPMHKENGITVSKARRGMSPFNSAHANQVNTTSTQQTSVPLSKFKLDKSMSPLSVVCSPFLSSSRSSTPSKLSTGISSSSTVESQKAKTPIDPPSQEPKNSKDQVFHLTEVVKSVSPNALRSTLTDICSMENPTDIIQDELSVMLEYVHKPPQKMRREFNVASVGSDEFVSDQGWDINTSETSTNKRIKIETKWAIMEEIKETNSKLLETSINLMTDTSEEDINVLGALEGTIVKCSFKNVCFPDLLDPQGHITSEKMPEFVILLLVPADYPATPPKISRSSRTILNSEPWGKVYEEMLTKFDLSLYGVAGISSLGDMARNWDASVRVVMTEFMQKRGAKSFSSRYGNWEKCNN